MKQKTKLIILAIIVMLIEMGLQICIMKFYVNPKFGNSDVYYSIVISVTIVFMLIYSTTGIIYRNKISRYD